jgi:prepilin-type N-terminal cleavage/methylation domain-containing protein
MMKQQQPIGQGTERGFTLVELMISLVLFSFAVAGVLSVAVSMTQAYREQRQVINAEASVRAPLDFLADAIRQASPGVSDPNNIQDFHTCKIGAIDFASTNNSSTGPDELDLIYATGGIVTTLSTAAFDVNSTQITVTDASQLSDGDFVLVTDFTYGMLVKIQSKTGNVLTLGTKCTTPTALTKWPTATTNYPVGSLIIRAQHAHFEIQTVDGMPTLTMDPDGDAANGGGTAGYEPLAENIEDMQIAYGVDADSLNGISETGLADNDDEWHYNVAGANEAPALLSKVRAIRVTLIARTSTALFGNTTSFYRRPAAEDHAVGEYDNYRRRVLRTIVELRNVGGSP